MFDLESLIEDFDKEQTYLIKQEAGYYDYNNGGIYVEGVTLEVPIIAAVVPLDKQDKLEYRENNTYISNVRKLYTSEDIQIGDKIKHENKIYTVQDASDYNEHAYGLGIYIIRRNDN